jgi:large subunit ribosomal protein L24
MKFLVGDEMMVTAGKDKGKHGKIERVFRSKNQVVVAGVNLYKKHLKNTSDRTKTGGIIDIAKPISVGNVALVCPKCTKPTRLGYRLVGDKKMRICRKCDQEI